MTITEKVSYLKGLTDGIGLDVTANEGKILKAILEVLDEIALAIEDLDDSVDEIASHVEVLDEDLASLEDDFYEIDDEDEDDDFEFPYDDDDSFEFKCSNCGAVISFDDFDFEAEEFTCPSCGETITLECDCDECNHE